MFVEDTTSAEPRTDRAMGGQAPSVGPRRPNMNMSSRATWDCKSQSLANRAFIVMAGFFQLASWAGGSRRKLVVQEVWQE